MGRFSTLTRWRAPSAPSAPSNHPGEWFAGVVEVLAGGGDGTVACAVLGRRLAREGVDLGTALDGLRAASAGAIGRDPSYAAIRALGVAWGEETLGQLHRISCVDPLTGLGTPAHLRARLAEAYATADEDGAGGPGALVVLELGRCPGDALSEAWWIVQLAERLRPALRGAATVCRIGRARIVVLTEGQLGPSREVANLRDLVTAIGPDGVGTRVWVEGLPATAAAAMDLVAELARAG